MYRQILRMALYLLPMLLLSWFRFKTFSEVESISLAVLSIEFINVTEHY